MVTQLVPPELAGEASLLITSALTLCSGAGPLLFGLLSEAFIGTAYPGGVFLILATVVLLDVFLCFGLPSNAEIEELRRSSVLVQLVALGVDGHDQS